MEQQGMSAEFAANFIDLGASIHSGAMRQDYDRYVPATMGTVTLEDFAREFAAAYNG